MRNERGIFNSDMRILGGDAERFFPFLFLSIYTIYIYLILLTIPLKYMELGPAIGGPGRMYRRCGSQTTDTTSELWVATGGTARYYNMQMNLPRRASIRPFFPFFLIPSSLHLTRVALPFSHCYSFFFSAFFPPLVEPHQSFWFKSGRTENKKKSNKKKYKQNEFNRLK